MNSKCFMEIIYSPTLYTNSRTYNVLQENQSFNFYYHCLMSAAKVYLKASEVIPLICVYEH